MIPKGKKLEEFLKSVKGNIFTFCRYMNFKPTWQQAQVLAAIQHEKRLPIAQRKKRIAVKSGQGPGKTTVTGLAALWLVLQGVGSKVVVTAPTARQCRDIFLQEVQRLLDKAMPLVRRLFKVYATKITVCGRKNWSIDTATATRPENIAGYHEENLTFIAEECSGIGRDIIETIKGTLSNDNALFIAIGNPTDRQSAFFDFFNNERHMWRTYTFNAAESPIVAQDNVARLREEFGEKSDVYRVRVAGEFPHSDPNCVISSEELELCTAQEKYLEALQHGHPRRQFGIDLARFGSDESVVYRVSNGAVVETKSWSKTEPLDVMDACVRMQLEATWEDDECIYVPDSTGMGQGVLRDVYRWGKQVFEFHNHGRPQNTKDFDNRITEAWFLFAREAREGHVYLPRDNRLIQQLSTRQYKITPQGKFKLESKDEYKKRTGLPSPDRADAIVLAFYKHASAKTRVARAG